MKTTIEHQFKLGDVVFFLDKEHRCQRTTVKSISAHVNEGGISVYYYGEDYYESHPEREVFASEEALKEYIFNPPLIKVV